MDVEPRLDMKTFEDIEVLSFWKKKSQHRYGDLALMASDLLNIPITTIAAESAFGVGGRVLTPFRNRLLPKNVQALIATRNWLRGFAKFEGTSSIINLWKSIFLCCLTNLYSLTYMRY